MIREFELGYGPGTAWFWAIGLVIVVVAWGILRSRRRLVIFGLDPVRFHAWHASLARRRWLRATVLVIALALLASSAAQPRCNPERGKIRTVARDIAVVIDVSRSMLAEDLKPNRLEHAKLAIDRLADRLEGHRIGLVAFAGDAVILCPLTSNYSYFRSVVRNLSTKSAEQGGTRIGDAIRKTLGDLFGFATRAPSDQEAKPVVGETFSDVESRTARESRYADILLITDGEDHDSYPLRAAEQARDEDVGLYVVGLGSESGTTIPARDASGALTFLEYKGEKVLSRLDSKSLREMVMTAPRGSYTPAGTDSFDLVEIFENTIGKETGREVEEEAVSWTEIYQPFLLAGIFFYLVWLLIPERVSGSPVAFANGSAGKE
jgi:Ca-activated chloride channel family protein